MTEEPPRRMVVHPHQLTLPMNWFKDWFYREMVTYWCGKKQMQQMAWDQRRRYRSFKP